MISLPRLLDNVMYAANRLIGNFTVVPMSMMTCSNVWPWALWSVNVYPVQIGNWGRAMRDGWDDNGAMKRVMTMIRTTTGNSGQGMSSPSPSFFYILYSLAPPQWVMMITAAYHCCCHWHAQCTQNWAHLTHFCPFVSPSCPYYYYLLISPSPNSPVSM